MATAKVRSTKRPSATSSYSSATTIVIFVGLSVLGLWLLTSNSFSPPQPTPTILTRIPSTADDNNSNPDPLHVQRSTEDNKPDEATVIDDLETKPEKAEATDQQESMGEPEKQEAMETQTSEESSMTHKQVVEMIKEEKQQSEMNAVADVTDQRKEENPLSETNVVADERDRRKEEDVFPETNAVANETDQRKEENPQSERNVVANEMDQRKEENLLPETNVVANETDHGSEATENQITDADQQKRVEEHQQRGDEQNQQEQEAKSKDPVGATSHDQIQHDEVEHVDSHQEKKIQETEHQEETNQETEHEPPVENGDSLSSIPKESSESKKSWSTQAHQSEDQKERRKAGSNDKENSNHGHTWLLCNVTAGADYIPCLDNEKAIAKIHKRLHHEHRERHCPEDPPTCLVPLTHRSQSLRGTRTG